jgi:iron complex transport system substrate-binding protein
MLRVFSHTASNTEIVCALGCAAFLVGVDADSDHPPEVVAPLPRPGRDLNLDIDEVCALEPDLVLTSLTVPGHEQIVAALKTRGCRVYVADPLSLDDVFADIRAIAELLGVPERGEVLAAQMDAAMPPVNLPRRPSVAVEWWPKPAIVPASDSWVNAVIERAGGRNPWAAEAGKSIQIDPAGAMRAAPELIVMAWCGVPEANYRADVVFGREGWRGVPAVNRRRVYPISEAYLGRPGPRLVEGYRRLCELLRAAATSD